MKSSDGGSTERPEKRLTARSKEPHQALTGRVAEVGSAKGGEHEGCLGRRGEVGSDLFGLVGRVLGVLVQRDVPGHLLRRRVDLDCADQVAHRRQQLPGYVAQGAASRRSSPAPAYAREACRRSHSSPRRKRTATGQETPSTLDPASLQGAFPRFPPDIDASVGRDVPIHLRQLLRRKREVVQGGDVLLELVHRGSADDE